MPTSVASRILPLDCSTKPNTMLSPSPVPRPGALVEKNGSNTRPRMSSLIPVPVSDTDTRTYASPAPSETSSSPCRRTLLVEICTRPPSGMASRALMTRLSRAVSSWAVSAMQGCRSGARSASTWMAAPAARRSSSMALLMSSLRSRARGVNV